MHIIRVFLRVSAYDTFYDMLAKKQKNKKKKYAYHMIRKRIFTTNILYTL